MPQVFRTHSTHWLLLATLLAAGGCSPSSYEDWMIQEGYWAVHTVCGGGNTVPGIDVSKWQATVDWAKVKADGQVFAIARASDGVNYNDSYFEANWKGMKAAGLIRGVYQYFRPSQDPTAQANLVLSKLQAAGGMQAGDLPAVLDLETAEGVAASTIVSKVDTWMNVIKKGTNRVPIIYTGSYFWDGSVISSKYANYPLWTAHYTSNPCPLVPNVWSKWVMWQYSSSGKVSGVSGNTDMNRFNGTLAELKAFAQASIINPTPTDAGPPPDSKPAPDSKPTPDKAKPDQGKPAADKGSPDKGAKKDGPKILDGVQPEADTGEPPLRDSGGKGKPDKGAVQPPLTTSSLDGGCQVALSGASPAAPLLLMSMMLLAARRRRSRLRPQQRQQPQ